MECLSISYKTTPSEVRSRFAFDRAAQREFLERSKEVGLSQCVLICTCNRTEVYFCGEADKTVGLLSAFSGQSAEIVNSCILRFSGKNAVRHLYKVACGIESMVVGEDEILGQTKNAYALAKEVGTVGYETNSLFLGAVSCAKKIKTDTALSGVSLSTATLAANAAARFAENVNVLIMGATGEIGSVVLKNLVSHKNVRVCATLRSHNSGFGEIRNSEKITPVDYSDRYKFLDSCNCVISATSSPHYTVTAHGMKENNITVRDRLFIDLAVPPDIDPEAVTLTGGRLTAIDDFERLARENNQVRQNSVEVAMSIIDKYTDELFKDTALHSFMPYMAEVAERYEKSGFEKLVYKLRADLTADQLRAVLKSLKEM